MTLFHIETNFDDKWDGFGVWYAPWRGKRRGKNWLILSHRRRRR